MFNTQGIFCRCYKENQIGAYQMFAFLDLKKNPCNLQGFTVFPWLWHKSTNTYIERKYFAYTSISLWHSFQYFLIVHCQSVSFRYIDEVGNISCEDKADERKNATNSKLPTHCVRGPIVFGVPLCVTRIYCVTW